MGREVLEMVTVDPTVLHGQACIAGTRLPVSLILDSVADGMTEAELRLEYPSLPEHSVQAAVAYGALLAREEVRYFGSHS